jgi:hypothetical protein
MTPARTKITWKCEGYYAASQEVGEFGITIRPQVDSILIMCDDIYETDAIRFVGKYGDTVEPTVELANNGMLRIRFPDAAPTLKSSTINFAMSGRTIAINRSNTETTPVPPGTKSFDKLYNRTIMANSGLWSDMVMETYATPFNQVGNVHVSEGDCNVSMCRDGVVASGWAMGERISVPTDTAGRLTITSPWFENEVDGLGNTVIKHVPISSSPIGSQDEWNRKFEVLSQRMGDGHGNQDYEGSSYILASAYNWSPSPGRKGIIYQLHGEFKSFTQLDLNDTPIYAMLLSGYSDQMDTIKNTGTIDISQMTRVFQQIINAPNYTPTNLQQERAFQLDLGCGGVEFSNNLMLAIVVPDTLTDTRYQAHTPAATQWKLASWGSLPEQTPITQGVGTLSWLSYHLKLEY